MAKHRTKKKQRRREQVSSPQERVCLRTRLLMLIVLVSMGGLFLGGYALGPERRWHKVFLGFSATPTQPLQDVWGQILSTEGCLVGQQDYHNGSIEQESILNNALCQQLIHGDREQVGRFLVSRMASQQDTHLHTCPYNNAKEGELAMYFLQHLAHANWFEYNGAHPTLQKYIHIRHEISTGKRAYEPAYTDQQLLWNIMDDAEALVKLQQYYLRKIQE